MFGIIKIILKIKFKWLWCVMYKRDDRKPSLQTKVLNPHHYTRRLQLAKDEVLTIPDNTASLTLLKFMWNISVLKKFLICFLDFFNKGRCVCSLFTHKYPVSVPSCSNFIRIVTVVFLGNLWFELRFKISDPFLRVTSLSL